MPPSSRRHDDQQRLPAAPPRGGQPLGSNFDWTPGFWTGMLWLAYELTGDERYRQGAEQQLPSYIDRLDRKIYVNTHDLGFLYTLSCVAPWRLTGSATALEAALAAADLLMVRYLDTAGIIQSWGDLDDPQQRGRAIVDSLMNMPLLYWATEVSGDGRFAAAAARHATQLRDRMVRPDNTTYHTFFWDPATGARWAAKPPRVMPTTRAGLAARLGRSTASPSTTAIQRTRRFSRGRRLRRLLPGTPAGRPRPLLGPRLHRRQRRGTR
ncbi:MAG: glycoside hydrolase family 88 protein [Caldilineaceae bacterium]